MLTQTSSIAVKTISNTLGHFRSHSRTVFYTLLLSTTPTALALLLHLWKNIPLGDLTRDLAAIGHLPVYAGFLSQIGLMLWSGTITTCLLIASHGTTDPALRALKKFMLYSGLFTALLAIDDAFLLHESLLPAFGVPEKIVFAAYFGITLAYLFRFYKLMRHTCYALMLSALACFALSILVDQISPEEMNLYLLEDGAKIAGIGCWMAYFLFTATDILKSKGASMKRGEMEVIKQFRDTAETI